MRPPALSGHYIINSNRKSESNLEIPLLCRASLRRDGAFGCTGAADAKCRATSQNTPLKTYAPSGV